MRGNISFLCWEGRHDLCTGTMRHTSGSRQMVDCECGCDCTARNHEEIMEAISKGKRRSIEAVRDEQGNLVPKDERDTFIEEPPPFGRQAQDEALNPAEALRTWRDIVNARFADDEGSITREVEALGLSPDLISAAGFSEVESMLIDLQEIQDLLNRAGSDDQQELALSGMVSLWVFGFLAGTLYGIDRAASGYGDSLVDPRD